MIPEWERLRSPLSARIVTHKVGAKKMGEQKVHCIGGAGRRRIERTERGREGKEGESNQSRSASSLRCQSIVRCAQATGRSGGHGSGSNDCRLKTPFELMSLHQVKVSSNGCHVIALKSCTNEMKVASSLINFTPQMPRTKTTINGRGVRGIGRREREGESSCSHSIRFHTLGEQRRRRRACPQDFPSFLFMDQTSKSARD